MKIEKQFQMKTVLDRMRKFYYDLGSAELRVDGRVEYNNHFVYGLMRMSMALTRMSWYT